MRGRFIRTLSNLAIDDPRIVLLTGDLGFMALESFSEKFPKRFFNVGVAEQNMVGIATGLAEAGFLPFVYSIVTFATLRAYEFIRNGPLHHRLPVRIVGVGGGLEYGTAGFSHHGLDDVGVFRVNPEMVIFTPADGPQASEILRKTWDDPRPIYYRLGKNDEVMVPGLDGRFEMGRVQVIRSGSGPLILSMGGISAEVSSAVEILVENRVDPQFAVVACLNPPPLEDLSNLLIQAPMAFTVEAHFINGGLGSLVSEIVAEGALGCRVVRFGVQGTFSGEIGSQRYLEKKHGLSSEQLVRNVLAEIHGSRP